MQSDPKESNIDAQSRETFTFNADINSLMSLIVNNFYSDKDIFLRELISNASDALDKLRHRSITDRDVLQTGSSLQISIISDKHVKTLTIEDSGIGMTKEELINNLGTVAKSGTQAFMKALKEKGDKDTKGLIGKFGVGFYSSFLVAHMVEVFSQHPDEPGLYVWRSSEGTSNFTVEPCASSESQILLRGTRIVLHLKDDALDYLEDYRLRQIIQKYSSFIRFPIRLWVEKEKEVDDDGGLKIEEIDEDGKVVDDTEDKKKKPKKKKKIKVKEWEVLNPQKPIWTRRSSEVTQEEYTKFYKALSNDWQDYLAVKHFAAEGSIRFNGVLYLPRRAPFDFEMGERKSHGIKLYSRCIFITDNCKDLMPSYLGFIKGVVDCEDLSLNVSREFLQKGPIIKTLRKNLIKKSIALMNEIVAEEKEEKKAKSRSVHEEKKKSEKKSKEKSKKNRFQLFYNTFGKYIKWAVYEDQKNRTKFAKFLRFYSSQSPKQWISLDDYVENMKTGQKFIYYVTGESLESLQGSPFLEALAEKGYDVIMMTEPIDEYWVQQLREWNEKQLKCVTKEGLDMEQSEEEKKKKKEESKHFSKLITKIKDVLGDKIEKVVLSSRLVSSPSCLVTGKFGWSANMERIMKAQALRDNYMESYLRSKKTMEINPEHSIIINLNKQLQQDPEDKNQSVQKLITLLFQTCLVSGGFSVEKPISFSEHVYSLINDKLDNTFRARL